MVSLSGRTSGYMTPISVQYSTLGDTTYGYQRRRRFIAADVNSMAPQS